MKNKDMAFLKNKTFGIKVPINRSNYGGIFEMSSDSIGKYKSNLYTLIFTNSGERVMVPRFGTRIASLLFENLGDDLLSSIKSEIIDATSRWIPEIKITSIEFKDAENSLENNEINMTINFSLKSDQTIQDFIDIEVNL